ncbi:hypothetical protein CTAYLR_004149 [Chrysophaeum taylorii]|uniref:SBF1/SBF2 domain-containing protein n=1 Tax=Chrysophaeum taylorii TaxID=2483200 RepID=A0AAD7XP71_9STRA|nr:hypothetical protein CTAYLR_004149 [Chrysophaeum taylorii]
METTERRAVALIGNEEAVGAFLLAGWGQRRVSRLLECNWFCVRESTPLEEIEATWRAFCEAPQVAVLLVSAAVKRRISSPATGATIVEIPCGDGPPRVTCTVYEPYAGWAADESSVARAFCASAPLDEEREACCPPAQSVVNERIDALVAAVFRLATIGDDDDEPDVRPAWTTDRPANAAMNFKLEVLNAATTEIAENLQAPTGARDFVLALNRQRTKMVDVSAAFPFLAGLTLTVLDRCQARRDVDAILTAMMLAQSFYRTKGHRREYLKAAIQTHPVWADVVFWRRALALCVRKQRASFSARRPLDDRVLAPPPPPRTEDDSPVYASCLPISFRFAAPPTESAERVALWSQLGGIVHAMLEFGTHPDAVRAFADAVCSEHDLSRQQRAIILQHIETVRRAQNHSDDDAPLHAADPPPPEPPATIAVSHG